MVKSLCFCLLVVFLSGITGAFAQNPPIAVSSYFNAADPRDEWSELLVTSDNLDIRNWTFQDNNSNQTDFQDSITFKNIALWNNLRAGTIIMIWHRSISVAGLSHPVDAIKQDGYIEVSANDPAYFSGGVFGTAPLFAGNTLNIAGAGDLLEILNASGTFVHALGHKLVVGSSWGPLPLPKLNYQGSLASGDAVFVCPGTILDDYGFVAPQDGTMWASKGNGAAVTFGLPNTCTASSTFNSDFWRSLRQPGWTTPTLTGNVNAGNTQVVLTWNAANDPDPADGTQGYMILRNTSNTFGTPLDGHTYTTGDNIGGAAVIALISSSQTLTYTDNITVPCAPGLYYRIYSFRFNADDVHGNDYDVARGRAYNEDESSYGSTQVTAPLPVAPVTATSDRNNFCADDPGNITLSATGGSGTTLNWYTVSCGGTLLGPGSGANNSITIPSPAVTTTYYARWENACGASACASVTVTVLPNLPVSVTISANQNPVCAGTPVTFTAVPVNPGTSPGYQWKVNGTNAGTNSLTFTYVPMNGDNVSVVLTSNESCTAGNPATSNIIVMTVTSAVIVGVTISANPGDTVCAGTLVTYTAVPSNGGTNPSYQWYLNGVPVGGNSPTWSNVPVNGDQVHCTITSSLSCAANNPATSNTIIISIMAAIPVGVTIDPNPGDTVCAGTTVTYTATPVNGGTNPSYQWYLNGSAVGGNSPTWSNVPVDGDLVFCVLTSSLSCASNNPASSNTIRISITSALQAGASITADPGDTVCAGTTVIYTAVPVNGGNNPSYQWFLNGNPVGGNNPVWSNVPVDGDQVFCRVTSSLSCAANNPANSDTIRISISSALVTGITITASPGDTVCAGTTVTYTAMPVNGGSSPSYQWFLNGTPAGGNNPTWLNVPLNGDVVYCRLTSSFSCATGNPATSNSITMVISSGIPVSAGISVSPGDTVCPGTAVTFTATPVNGGASPAYQWYLNGNPAGSNNPVYAVTPANGDAVYCMVTSSLTCAVNNPATSQTIIMVHTAAQTASVNISATPSAICSGTRVTFTASAVNEGASPLFEWLVDGVVVKQGNAGSYVTDSLSPGQTVTCRMTSSLSCLVANPVLSPSVILASAPLPEVKLADNPILCAGETAHLDAGADFTAYHWQDGSTGRYYDATDEGIYWVTVTDTLGCKGGDTVQLLVCDAAIWLPTAFTPDGDGLNDEFRAVMTLDGVSNFSMLIFDRWGRQVFESGDPSTGWNGILNGQLAPPGTYAWKITYQTTSQGVVSPVNTLHGTITLVR
jgi:gliding motility-associated-like protein